MQANRRNPFFPVLAIALMVGALAACGVKGELEAPGKSAAASDGAKAADVKVFSEQSRVQRVSPPGMMPPFPPKEWTKGRIYQPEPQPAPAGSAKRRPSDTPFILDGLL